MPINSTTSPDALAEWEELARLARLMAPIWESYDANNPYHTQLMLAWRQACAPERIARLVAAAQRGAEDMALLDSGSIRLAARVWHRLDLREAIREGRKIPPRAAITETPAGHATSEETTDATH